MVRATDFHIVFSSGNGVCEAGGYLKGRVFFRLPADYTKTVANVHVTLIGRCKVKYPESGPRDSDSAHYKDEEVYFNKKVILTTGQSGGLCELGGGLHVYDFSVLIPANSPSSFEGCGKFGYVRYMIHAAIENKYGYTTMAKHPLPFTVVHQLDLNDEHSSVATPGTYSSSQTQEGCFSSPGRVSASVTLNKRGFVPGEHIVIDAEITNESSLSISCTRAALKMYVTYRGKSTSFFSHGDPGPVRSESEILNTVTSNVKVKAHQTRRWNSVKMRIPPCAPSRLAGCSFIDINYILQFYVVADSTMRIKAAVIIGTVPLRQAAASPTWPLGDSHQPISRQHVRLPQTPYTAPPGGDLSPHDPSLPSYNDLVRTDSPGVGTSHSPGGTVFRAPDGTTVNLPAGLRRAQSPSTAPPGGQSAASTPHDPCTGSLPSYNDSARTDSPGDGTSHSPGETAEGATNSPLLTQPSDQPPTESVPTEPASTELAATEPPPEYEFPPSYDECFGGRRSLQDDSGDQSSQGEAAPEWAPRYPTYYDLPQTHTTPES